MRFCWPFTVKSNGIFFSDKFTIEEFITNNAGVRQKPHTHHYEKEWEITRALHVIYIERAGEVVGLENENCKLYGPHISPFTRWGFRRGLGSKLWTRKLGYFAGFRDLVVKVPAYLRRGVVGFT